MRDDINSPPHYEVVPGLEAWDVIAATLTEDELRGYCLGNILKYRLRAGEKGPADQCIAKANWYRQRLDAGTAVVGPEGNVVETGRRHLCARCGDPNCPGPQSGSYACCADEFPQLREVRP